MRVLLVQALRSADTSRIGDSDMLVECAEDADEAMSVLARETYDLVLLDMRSRPFDGFDLIRRLRQSRNNTPLLALTGIAACDGTRARWLGASDTMTDPVDGAELRARMISAIHCRAMHGHSPLQLGNLSVYLATGEVRLSGTAIRLTPKEFSLLDLLVRRRNQMITKQMILEHLYSGTDAPPAQIVDVFICKLRRKLEHAGLANAIVTVWRGGYMLLEANARMPAVDAQTAMRERQLVDRIRRLVPASVLPDPGNPPSPSDSSV